MHIAFLSPHSAVLLRTRQALLAHADPVIRSHAATAYTAAKTLQWAIERLGWQREIPNTLAAFYERGDQ